MKLHPNAKTTPHIRHLIVHRATRQAWTAAEAAEILRRLRWAVDDPHSANRGSTAHNCPPHP